MLRLPKEAAVGTFHLYRPPKVVIPYPAPLEAKEIVRMRLNKLGSILGSVVVLGGFTAASSACLSRPVEGSSPSTKVSFTAKQKANAVDKIDLLLAIDDSASMSDKQKFLAKAVPVLVSRLVTPNCVDADGKPVGGQATVDAGNPDGKCANGVPEFKAITDIHIGIVTSSMGNFGTTATCDTKGTNLSGRLIDASKREQGIKAEEAGFLAYFPTNAKNDAKKSKPGYVAAKNPYQTAADLNTAFTSLVTNVGEIGCGYEAQLESVYHFLMQPDPWAKVVRDGDIAKYEGVDELLLHQRKDFLRPDSLLAVIMLTDENDSAVDPLSLQGRGWLYMATTSNGLTFPGYSGASQQSRTDQRFGVGTTAPGGTSACASDPNSGECLPCWASKNKDSDPACAKTLNQEDDPADLRFYHMKQRFGWDPQYPIQRYISGFAQGRVPNRDGEHDGAGNYKGDAKCVNPIYAKELPDPTQDAAALCNLEPGPRDSTGVFFAVIGGVPQDLLRDDKNVVKAKLTDADWTKILGKDPGKYDLAGIDPRMIESATPRDGTDKTTDWDSKKGDLMYACTFDLPADLQRKGTNGSGTPSTSVETTVFDCSKYWDSPLCDKPLTKNDGTDTTLRTQIKAKAYPTIRELRVVRGLGQQGVAASICAQKVTGDSNDPNFGYNPAVNAIVDRLKAALANQCLPEPLNASADGSVPCLILERLKDKGEESLCNNAAQGRKIPDAQILQRYIDGKLAEDPKSDIADYPICELVQTPKPTGESCETETTPGFCYVQNGGDKKPAKGCSQAVVYAANTFSGDTLFQGSTIELQCISQQEQTTTP